MYKRYVQNFSLGNNSEYYDVVVVGAGVAGLFASLTLKPELKVLLLAKEGLRDCNSQLAQGGIAMTLDEDYESHIQDTLKAGSFYNDPAVVETMIRMSRPVFDQLVAMKTDFDKNEDGSISKTAEGGHRKRRIVHSKDLTGEAVMNALIEELKRRSNIQVLTQTFAADLLTDEKAIRGLAYQRVGQAVETVSCQQVILATGGIGGLFKATTNVSANTGDGMAMALRAGAALRDSEFIQYHPTAMALRAGGYFLISEAVRGEGGYLINDLGERFMDGQHEMKELAPRDVVAKAINDQKLLGRSVYVDVRHFETGAFAKRFPNIYATCLANGIDPLVQPIPVSPVEHYYMGGISCSADGMVLNANGQPAAYGLFASGEAACTGFHGANRLASNSLLECLALSQRITDRINETVCAGNGIDIGWRGSEVSTLPQMDEVLLNSLCEQFHERFSAVFTIVKDRAVLTAALSEFEEMLAQLNQYQSDEAAFRALYNGLMLAREIALGSLGRQQSLGAFIIAENQQA